MKTWLSTALAVWGVVSSWGGEAVPPVSPVPAPAPAPAASGPSAVAPAPSPALAPAPAPSQDAGVQPSITPAEGFPPVVRLPVAPENESPSESGSNAGSATGAGAGSADLGWKADGVTLRQPAGAFGQTTLRTNRSFETRGVVPRLVRPERRGVGGFLVGFANLFNPMAPTRQGVATSDQYWYDGSSHAAPLPRAFRDERSHEPTTSLISVDLDGDLDKAEPASAPPPAKARTK